MNQDYIMSYDIYDKVRKMVTESNDENKENILDELFMAQYEEETNSIIINPYLQIMLQPYIDIIFKDGDLNG